MRLPCSEGERTLWRAALELSRRVAGEPLPTWGSAEMIAAEASSGMGREPGSPAEGVEGPEAERSGRPAPPSTPGQRSEESGLRERAFPRVSWRRVPASLPGWLARLAEGLDGCAPREIDRRLRAAIAFLQSADLETGRILRQMVDRGLFAEIGFDGLGRYAEERLDCSGRTARRLVALARVERRVPALGAAFRRGGIHAFQAHALARVADPVSARAWIERARAVSYRRLEEETETPDVAFLAPRSVAAFFLETVARAGSLARLLAHVIVTWLRHGARFRDYADFARDGYRCVVPGCTARRGLESHHVRYRSRGGPDASWNRVTLCHGHHRRGVHAGNLSIRGRAPGALVFELGVDRGERFGSGDLRVLTA